MRPPAELDTVQIDITSRCAASCSNCTLLTAHQAQPSDMPLATLERAVGSLQDWGAPGKVIDLIGGEPTLHGDFETLSRRFADLWGSPIIANGRSPVRDYNAFANERREDRASGRGLRTGLGDSYYRHAETILGVYGRLDVDTHEAGRRMPAILITRQDYLSTTGLSDEAWVRNRDHCWSQALRAATINDNGAYFCEVAGAIDRLYFGGRHAWPVESGWWRRGVDDLTDQIELCDYCGLAQPGPVQPDHLGREIISAQHETMLASVGSPVIHRRTYEVLDADQHLFKFHRSDDPVADAGRRVGIGDRSIKPRKLTCVLTSVGYGDDLAQTLPHNRLEFDEIVVVTTHDDVRTQEVAKANGAILVLSDRCFDDDHAFNKGKMLNDGLKVLQDPDWIVFTDADIVMKPGLYATVMGYAWNPGCLYFTRRLDDHAVEGKDGAVDFEPNGYFQLFNAHALAIRDSWPNIVSENFCSAGSVDSWFYQQWARGNLFGISDIQVRHIASAHLGENWNGRQQRPRKWRQFGVMTADGISPLKPAGEVPETVRLTDTLHGNTITTTRGEIIKYVQTMPDRGLVFLGRPIGHAHIHVAYFAD